MKLLFVCLGNICRSPAAEAVMNKLIDERGLGEEFSCDSAGTCGYHAGQQADGRMRSALMARGYVSHSISRKVDPSSDFDEFDFILAMDRQNLDDLERVKPLGSSRAKVSLICDYANKIKDKDVPDPYYGGAAGFDRVIDILEDVCANFLDGTPPKSVNRR